MKRRIILLTLLAIYILFLFDIALFRFPASNPEPNLVPFRTISEDWQVGGKEFVVNFLGNLVAFMPMGIVPPLVRTRRTRAWQVALFSLVLSLTIEGGQYASGRRVADVDDLILNTLGGLLGYALVGAFRGSGRSPKKLAADVEPQGDDSARSTASGLQ
jgi:glycopeptide antibiotics resistance protein